MSLLSTHHKEQTDNNFGNNRVQTSCNTTVMDDSQSIMEIISDNGSKDVRRNINGLKNDYHKRSRPSARKFHSGRHSIIGRYRESTESQQVQKINQLHTQPQHAYISQMGALK
eukprot:888446_1